MARTHAGASAASLILSGMLLVRMGLVDPRLAWAQARNGRSVPQEYRSGDQSPQQVRPPSSNLPDLPSRVPVDGGLGFLALVGAGYAVRKLGTDDDESFGGPA